MTKIEKESIRETVEILLDKRLMEKLKKSIKEMSEGKLIRIK